MPEVSAPAPMRRLGARKDDVATEASRLDESNSARRLSQIAEHRVGSMKHQNTCFTHRTINTNVRKARACARERERERERVLALVAGGLVR
eukprot:10864571-Heterocapsa_arctica.AAC.1